MIELYLHEQTLKMERELLNQQSGRRAAWLSRLSESDPAKRLGKGRLSLRRRLALALLALADRLDPSTALRSAHTPRRPSLNGTLGHA
jgi:hypothetical protein